MEEIKPLIDPSLKKVPSKNGLSKVIPAIVVVIILAAGVFSGLVLSSRGKSAQAAKEGSLKVDELPEEQQQSFNQTFRDSAEGTVEKNDELDKYAQGTHKLVRPGGEEQTAYLTSTVLDLDEYDGKKVKVFGETFGSQQVGWLMDVGKVEVLE